MYLIKIKPLAEQDLINIWRFIAENNPEKAKEGNQVRINKEIIEL